SWRPSRRSPASACCGTRPQALYSLRLWRLPRRDLAFLCRCSRRGVQPTSQRRSSARPVALPGFIAAVVAADWRQSAINRRPRDPKKSPDDLAVARNRKSGRADRLWARNPGSFSSGRRDGAQGLARRQRDRVAGGAADAISTRGEFEDREVDRHHAATIDSAARRRGDRMKRRAFITLLGGAAAAWPLVARAQQPAMPVIGFLHAGAPEPRTNLVAAFRLGLSEAGFVEGRDVQIEYRWARDQSDQLPGMVADLIHRQVAIIATPDNAGALAAKAATEAIPIVFQIGDDPVKLGLVSSLNRPGGNATGVSYFTFELGPKRLGLLLELMPSVADVVVLANPKSPITGSALKEVQAAASAAGKPLSVVHASTSQEINAAFPAMAQKRSPALVIIPSALFVSRRVQLATLAARHAIPAIYTSREFVEVGGLMSYGTNLADNYRLVGAYTGRILKGAKPADLPVVQPTKFEFVINLATAMALSIELPDSLLALADELIA